MAWAYLDTSAMVKRYLDEPGHREVLRILRRHDLVSAALLPVELRGAIRRRLHDRTLDAARAERVLKRFAADREVLTMVELTAEVLAHAESLVSAYPIRALDAVHVGSARVFGLRIGSALRFVSADRRQTEVAAWIGLDVTLVG